MGTQDDLWTRATTEPYVGRNRSRAVVVAIGQLRARGRHVGINRRAASNPAAGARYWNIAGIFPFPDVAGQVIYAGVTWYE